MVTYKERKREAVEAGTRARKQLNRHITIGIAVVVFVATVVLFLWR